MLSRPLTSAGLLTLATVHHLSSAWCSLICVASMSKSKTGLQILRHSDLDAAILVLWRALASGMWTRVVFLEWSVASQLHLANVGMI